MQLEIILFAILCNYLRKHLQKTNAAAGWDIIFTGGIIFSILLILTNVFLPSVKPFNSILSSIILLGTAYLILKREEFKNVRFVVYTFLPFVAINLAEDVARLISPSFSDKYDNITGVAQFFSLVWLFVMLYVYNKQRKTLEKERQKASQKEEELKISEALKQQLEIQVGARTAELRAQKEELEKTIIDLKATQDQLIHAEKMASLGELTAGIAHEIQNPLNFVNNFAEINSDLINDVQEEIKAGNTDEVIALTNDLKQNNEKISYHGKRAESIVKGMLQHSRKSSGNKEQTDINNLIDECIRLSFHGLRAKDKSFNADFTLDLDKNAGSLNIVPQDIGRVLLNIFNNAFYAVTEKKLQGLDGYEPKLIVNSYRQPDKFVITITDNGNGIPAAVQEKIFQPFFTTKPTGKGTGLGLSISYDIIVKGHGGKIKIDSKEGEYTTFIIELPIKEN